MKRVAVTMGDAAGIGPEVILKALQDPLVGIAPVLYGAREVFERVDSVLAGCCDGYVSLAGRFVSIDAPAQLDDPAQIGVIDVCPELDASDIEPGEQDPRAARMQLAALERAIDATSRGECIAICTAPWTKELFRLIDEPAVGHTEVLARAFDAPRHVMMLAGSRLRVSLATVHVPIQDVSAKLTEERLRATIETTIEDLGRLFGCAAPRIAVCGLNPHAGEHGVMGEEEDALIRPVIAALSEQYAGHATITGPLPSDTLFAKFRDAMPYDAVICMYHDQGLIPLKLLHFGASANITLGLPVVRTSVDHGSAYDIAGKGIARGGSMRHALELAVALGERIEEKE